MQKETLITYFLCKNSHILITSNRSEDPGIKGKIYIFFRRIISLSFTRSPLQSFPQDGDVKGVILISVGIEGKRTFKVTFSFCKTSEASYFSQVRQGRLLLLSACLISRFLTNNVLSITEPAVKKENPPAYACYGAQDLQLNFTF